MSASAARTAPAEVVGHPPAREGVGLPEQVMTAAKRGESPPVAIERILDPAEVQMKAGPLRLQAGSHDAA